MKNEKGGPTRQTSNRSSVTSTFRDYPPGQNVSSIEIAMERLRSEKQYQMWWTAAMLIQDFRNLPEDTCWNCYICILTIVTIVWNIVGFDHYLCDVVYNISYAIHVLSIYYNNYALGVRVRYWQMFGYLVDLATFVHYLDDSQNLKILCYYCRLHRPFRYLFSLIDFKLKGSILGTTAKYCYIFLVLRITWAFIWLHIDKLEDIFYNTEKSDRNLQLLVKHLKFRQTDNEPPTMFLSALYLVNKMFIPIGPSMPPVNDIERCVCLLVMLTGSLVVTGFAVASLSLVISLYMRPEEAFRTRYRLIIKDMKESHIPPSQREKVQTFYKMYWHKQKAVSATQLLPTFPPTLPATIYMDIYFAATQKSRILKDLTYQFLSELAKHMETIHYIPGDTIIKRSSKTSSLIYITYGDIELVTPEDDSTAILRMTRGTILSPCGVCSPGGFGRAHLQVRAATFCTAHLLHAQDLWRVAAKYGRDNDQVGMILDTFNIHLERVKKHCMMKIPENVKHLSSILHLKRCLMGLKEAKNTNGQPLMARTDFFLEIAGCYIMRNRTEISFIDEADAICLRPTFPCILQPTSSLQFAWHSFVACLTVAVCFIHPYYLVFKKTVPIQFRFFDYIVTAIYVLDLIVHLSTGDNVEGGVPITFTQTSSQQMKSPWFVQDVLSTLPIFEFIGSGHFAGINKILRIPKVFRVLKELEDICVYRSNVLRFLSYTLLMLIACFLIASLQQGFMCFQFGHCLVTNLTHSPYWENKPLDEETLENRITFGLYWAISMIMFTTHYESWGTESWYNVLYAMMILEICIVLRIFMEAVYSATIMVTTALREDYDAAISLVKSFLIRNQVDPILRQRFIDYLQLCWFTDKAYSMTNKKSIFYDLPSHVYQDIVAKQCSKYILCIPLLKYLHREDLKKISSNARLFHTSPNEILINTGDISNEIYVIKRGICEVLSPDTKDTVDYLSVKCHFGALACLLRLPAFYTIRAVTHVQVFCISRKYLMPAIEIVPRIKDAMDFAKQQPEFQSLNRRREPFASYVPPAPTPNMERFRLPRKHEQDYAFLQPFHYLGFFSILRYIFPRFTIRPDGRYLVRYECFRAVCAFLTAIVYPAYSYLVLQWPVIYYISILLDMSAYFDIFQRMLVGFFNEQGILIYHPVSTASHYVKGAFMIDVFGSIALERLESVQSESGRYRVTQMEQFLMLNRLIQLYRLPSAMHILHHYIERRDIRIVLQAIPLFIVLLNVLTCFMILYSVNIFYSDDGNWEIIPNNDKGGSWIKLCKNALRFNLTETPWNLHLATYFWVVYETTTTGYNMFYASNFELIRVLFIGMVIGAMIITYFSVRIISVRANVNKLLGEFQEHMKDMVDYMRRENLHGDLQRDVLAYYEYNWDKMGGVDYRHMFKLCNQITLRTDIILHIYGPTFGKCPILSQSDASLLRMVGRAVHSRYYLRGMSIIDFSDVISDMYFVDYGEVAFRETTQDMSYVVKLSRGSVFGNLDGAENIRCPMMVVAHSKLHLLMINSQAFHDIIKDFPTVQQLMTKYRPNANLNYIKSYASDSVSPWKVRSLSMPRIVRRRKGLIKHLYFRDTYVQRYLIIVSLLCVYADVYNAGFQDNRFWLIIILYVLDLGFYFKIVIQYSLPVIVESTSVRNVLIPKRREYFQTEFKYDILSCIPLELLSVFGRQHRWMLFSWLRLNRTFRITTLFKSLKRHHERITINLILSTMFSVFIWFTLFVHTIACLWYFIGVMEDKREPKSSWRYKDDGQLWCDNLYLCSLYFVLTTFTQNGVGDILPRKHSEVIFVCILQIISTMIYMIYVGEFSNIIQYQSFRSFSFYTKYLELQEFLGNNRVSANLVRMVNKYCLHLWRESRGMQAPHFLGTAPYSLRLRIMSAAYMHHLTKHHVFEDCEPAFLRQLVGCLQIYTYNEDMYVVKAREITDAMYLIHTGQVKEISHETCEVTRVCQAGSYFGVLQGLFRNTPYTHSYQTLAKSQVLTLRLDDWFFLLKHFPESCACINKHMRRDDSQQSNISSSSHYGWPYHSPKPPMPRVTEIVDRSSQPSPHLSTEGDIGKSSTFIPPAGPALSTHNLQSDDIDHERWPTNSRRTSDYHSFEQINNKLDSNQSTHVAENLEQAEHHDQNTNNQSNSKNNLSNQSNESQTGIFLLQEDIMTKSDENKRLSDTHYIELDENDNIPILEKDSGESTVSKKEPPVFALEIFEPKPGVSGTSEPDKRIDKEFGVIDLQMQTGSEKFILADGDADELIIGNRSLVFEDTKDVATSTSKLKRRAVRVRYEEDHGNSKKPSGSTELSSNGQSTNLTITEQSLRSSDSDKSDTKDEEETSSSSANNDKST